MASYNAPLTKHATLTSTTVDTVTLTGPVVRLTVWNRAPLLDAEEEPSPDLWITRSLDGNAPPNPTAGGDGTYWVPPQGSCTLYAHRGVQIKVLGDGNAYSVEGEEEAAI